MHRSRLAMLPGQFFVLRSLSFFRLSTQSTRRNGGWIHRLAYYLSRFRSGGPMSVSADHPLADTEGVGESVEAMRAAIHQPARLAQVVFQ